MEIWWSILLVLHRKLMTTYVNYFPSVSAFYAECPSKRFYVNATVGTKTKFLGLSVKAQNNGTGTSH